MQKITYQSIRTSLIERREKRVKWKDIGKDYPGVPLGTLCRIEKDADYEPKDSALRIALGLRPLHVTVDALPCGHGPSGKRCAICNPVTRYAPHPVKRVTAIKRLLQNPMYRDS